MDIITLALAKKYADEKLINIDGSSAQSDWNQNDETALDYIKNRPFYVGAPEEVVLLEETAVEVGDELYATISNSVVFEVGVTYVVVFNGTRYECIAWGDNNSEIFIGNGSIISVEGGNDEPFCCIYYFDGCDLITTETGTYTISINSVIPDVHKIDTKYLPTLKEHIVSDELSDSYNLLSGANVEDVLMKIVSKTAFKFNDYGIPAPNNSGWYFMAEGNGVLIAIPWNSSKITEFIYSHDGQNWESVTVPSSEYMGICYGGGKFIATSSSASKFAYSEDGVIWTQTASPSSVTVWSSICYGNGTFVTMEAGMTSHNHKVAYSKDGITWTTTRFPSSQYWNDMCYGDGKFVAVSGSFTNNSNVAAYSEDGVTWHSATLPSKHWTKVCYGNGKFVAVTRLCDAVAYSEDGIVWNSVDLPESESSVQQIEYIDGIFIAISENGTVFYSENAIDWNNCSSGANILKCLAYINGKIIVSSHKSIGCLYRDINDLGFAYISDIPSSTQPDYNQNDETANDYIKNRTHYEVTELLVEETSVTVTSNGSAGSVLSNAFDVDLIEGDTYIVTFDGTEYKCVAMMHPEMEAVCIGASDASFYNICYNITKQTPPFLYAIQYTSHNLYAEGTHTISIAHITLKKLDNKFLNDDVFIQADLSQNEEVFSALIEIDAISAVTDSDESILTDENNNILLW